MLVNVILITGYTLGCHSIRHIVGGDMNCMSCSHARTKAWTISSMFNSHHQQFAWTSLITVCLTDLYIRLVGMHVFTIRGSSSMAARESYEQHEYDVLVVGAGGAGLRPRLRLRLRAASRSGLQVLAG